MVKVSTGLGKVASGAAKGGVWDAGLTAATVTPKVIDGELSVGEGVQRVARAGVRGTAQGAAWVGAETVAVGIVATVGAPAVVATAIGAGAAWLVGSLFDSIFD